MSEQNEDGDPQSRGLDRRTGTRRPVPEDRGDAYVHDPVARPADSTAAQTQSKVMAIAVPVSAVAMAAIISTTLPLAAPQDPQALGIGGWVYLAIALLTAVFLLIPAKR